MSGLTRLLQDVRLARRRGSVSIDHFASPLPVLVAVQPGGGAPVFRLSKVTVSANAMPARVKAVSIAVVSVVIGISFCSGSPL